MELIKFKSKAYTCHPDAKQCKMCLDPKYEAWRLHETGMKNFSCPHGKQMVGLTVSAPTKTPAVKALKAPEPPTKKCNRAGMTVENIVSFFTALTVRGTVSTNVSEQRAAACKACDLLCSDEQGDYCGAGCGCAVATPAPVGNFFARLVQDALGVRADLTLYSEYQDGKFKPLCKHYGRAKGKGWPCESIHPTIQVAKP